MLVGRFARVVRSCQARLPESNITQEKNMVKNSGAPLFRLGRDGRGKKKDIHVHLVQTEMRISRKSKVLLEESFAELRRIWSLTISPGIAKALSWRFAEACSMPMECVMSPLPLQFHTAQLDNPLIAAVIQSLNVATAHDCYAVHHGGGTASPSEKHR